MRGKVYVIQEVFRYENGVQVPIFDFRKAAEYGDLEVCLPSGKVSLSPGPTVNQLNDKLRNFSDDDYLVAVGDPSAIAIAGAIAANNNRGKFSILKWDKNVKQYIKVSVDLYPHRRANSQKENQRNDEM